MNELSAKKKESSSRYTFQIQVCSPKIIFVIYFYFFILVWAYELFKLHCLFDTLWYLESKILEGNIY